MLYGEIIKLADRTNYIFESFDGFKATTGQANITPARMFPILPALGLVFRAVGVPGTYRQKRV